MSRRFFKKKVNTQDTTAAPQGRSSVKPALGLRKCVEAQDVSRAIDIVFVHGLTGDREKTWTYQPTDCFWPEKLLPSDVPNARIFTYGYDADVAHFFSSASQSRIGDHANELLSSLVHARERSETGSRPVIFVAHSLGGLVVEDMLLSAKNSAEETYRQVLESTEGVVFMGTPHCGSQLADWAGVFTSVAKLVRSVNQSIITVLQPGSEVLARIQQEFHTMIRARSDAGRQKLRIMCYFEDLNTPGVGPVVPKHSAILPAYKSMSIPKDHAGMTKFSDAKDPGYKGISDELWMWARDLERRRDAAQLGTSSVSPCPPPEQPQLLIETSKAGHSSNFYFLGPMSNFDHVFQGNNTVQYGAP